MSPIHWNDDNSVGDAHIDQQHLEWVRIFNTLEDAILEGNQSNSAQVDLLKQILDFTREHFLEEERIMAIHGYPDIVRHRRMHKEFELQLYEKFRMVMAKELVLRSELIAMIRHWFLSHTSSEDKRAFEFIRSTTGRT
jgi:hemerythrin-like metal-binding protein